MHRGMIGVFDSGFGGLHTLRALRAMLPSYDYLYLADSARAPYGPRPADEIRAFSTEAVTFLFESGCELVIIACNTASSDALRFIQQTYMPEAWPDRKLLGVLIPLCEMAALQRHSKRVGVIATEGTVRSGAFVRELVKLDPLIQIFQEAAPSLVPLIEAGEHVSPAMQEALQKYLQPLIHASIDTLILGCTHYGFAIDEISRIVGPDIAVISDADAVAPALASYLVRHADLDDSLSRDSGIEFCTTGEAACFNERGRAFFGAPVSASYVHIAQGNRKQ